MGYTVKKVSFHTTTTFRKQGRKDNVVPHVATVELYCIDNDCFDIYHDNDVITCINGSDKAWSTFESLVERIKEVGYVWDNAGGYRITGEY